MQEQIRVKFVGFWPGFDENNNFLINSLRKHHSVALSENPQYLFSSCFSEDYLDYGCIRIFYTGENLCPNFNVFDYAIGYEHMEFGDRYLRFPNYMIPEIYGSDFEKMKRKHCSISEEDREKKDFCSFVVSKGDGYVAKERERIFYMLSEYRHVDSGGRFLNNIDEKDGVKDKLDFQRKHKFAIAFENSSHPGYSTEKLVQAFAAETVPIYWGDSRISEIFNENAFINCHKYKDFHEVIEEVKRVDQDDNAYLSMLAAPALNDENIELKYKDALDKFLAHIIEQGENKAYRRDMTGYGLKEADRLKEIRNMEQLDAKRTARKNKFSRIFRKERVRHGERL